MIKKILLVLITLTIGGNITMAKEPVKFKYDSHYTEGQKVTFKKQDLKIAGLLFLPDNFNKNKKYPAIVVTHPGGGVKEQTSSLYAYSLSKAGFVTLSFDASHQGESEGLPRFLEDPTSRVEDIRSAVDYLVSLPYVDDNKIGAMGICAGGGYSMSAIQTESRIKAAAGVSSWDVGDTAKNGFPVSDDPDYMKKVLTETAKQRTREARGEKALYVGYLPNSESEMNANTPTIQKEGYEYYRTSRAGFPTSENKMLFTSNDKLAAFDAFAHIETVSPRPILLIVGGEADTIYFSEKAYKKANEPKELYKIKGASHIDLYDRPEYVSVAVDKLTQYFNKYLK